jgi:hypothetical protein
VTAIRSGISNARRRHGNEPARLLPALAQR